jgi:hypothetical protein
VTHIAIKAPLVCWLRWQRLNHRELQRNARNARKGRVLFTYKRSPGCLAPAGSSLQVIAQKLHSCTHSVY